MSESLPSSYFDRIYQANRDPWNFEGSEYEAGKYCTTLDTLVRPQYGRAFEIGCSIGVLTEQLARRSRGLLSVDVAELALEQARLRCAHLPHVQIRRMSVPSEYPEGRFDLTVVSEVGYYLSRSDLHRLGGLIGAHTEPGGQLLLVHWLPRVDDYPLTGDQVHQYFLSLPEWRRLRERRTDLYRIDLLEHSALLPKPDGDFQAG